MYNNYSSSPTLNNCIVWGNSTTTGMDGQQFYLDGAATALNYCCYANGTNDVTMINGGTFTDTNNNITTNPKFVDPAGDFRIHGNSPCVNTGFNDYFTFVDSVDIRGEARIQDDTIDMGAYEWTSAMDPLTDTVYVNNTATGSNNGTDWANALTSFQSALNLAASGDQIWVAAGIYTPDYAYDLTDSSRYYHFRMIEGVAIYGGFAGTEDSISQRTDFGMDGANETFLSGDIETLGDNTDNCYHVFYHPAGLNLTSTSILDGFTITEGNSDGNYPHDAGGGMFNYNSSPTIANATFSLNSAAESGGGMVNAYSSPTITNTTFSLNSASVIGGGMANTYSSPTITNVTFSLNSADSLGGGICNLGSSPSITNVTFSMNSADNLGGGIYNLASSPAIINATFSANTAAISGGGIFNSDSDPDLTNVIFLLNTAVQKGGGIYNDSSSPTITNVSFSMNSAGNQGGGIYNLNSSASLFNSIVWGNTASAGSQLYMDRGSTSLNYCCYANGAGDTTAVNSAVFTVTNENITADPEFVDPAGDLRLFSFSPCVNAGFNDYFTLTDSVDIRGEARIQDTTIDMGAYEWISGTDPHGIYYVKHDAAPINDGTSWDDAFTSIQSALDISVGGDQVWVATGTYYPSYDYGLDIGERGKHFRMIEGVKIYGGFAGTEDSINQRTDFGYGETNKTILSGDIGNEGDNTDNCYHVFFHPTGSNLTASAILDGFTITGGNADGADPHNNGGGMFNENSSPTIANTTFSSNSASYGGGMYNFNSSPTTINATFSENFATYGGGMCSKSSSSPTLNNSIVWNNTAATSGNQFYMDNATTTLNYSCYADGNINVFGGTLTTYDCTTSDPLLDDNYHLTWENFPDNDNSKSPCIDSGNPDLNGNGSNWLTDPDDRNPDQSRMDMGAQYYHQEPTIYFYDAIDCDNPPGPYDTDCYNFDFEDEFVNTSTLHHYFNIVNRVDKFTDIEFTFSGSHPADFNLNSPFDTILDPLQDDIPVLPYFQPTGTGQRECNLQVVSDGVILAEVLLIGNGKGSGNIEGYVYAPGAEIPVSGVKITIFREQYYQGNLVDTISFYDTTNLNGKYYLASVGFGSDYEFKVTPYHMTDGIEHEFNPPYYDEIHILSENEPYPVDDFIDVSVFPVEGFVFYQGTQCPVEDVVIEAIGINPTPTNEEGSYQIALPIGEHTITLSKPGHTFNPPDTTINVIGALANINFKDEYTHHLHGFIGGACEISLTLESGQKIELNVHHVSECMADITIEPEYTGDSAGFYAIDLPPGLYQLSIANFYTEDFPGEPLNYSPVELDLLENDTLMHDIIFLTEPLIDVSWLDSESDTAVYYLNDTAVLHQINKYTAIVDVYRTYVNDTCHMPPGDTIQVYDGISDEAGWKDLIITDTTLYTFYAGTPNINSGGDNPYQKKLQFQYVYNPVTKKVVEQNIWTYVLGIKPRAQAFTTATPQIPLWILRDPPGDNSYSFWEQNKSVSQAISFSMAHGEESSNKSTVSMGLDYDFSVGFIVQKSVSVALTADASVSHSSQMTQNSLTENQITYTTSVGYTTSAAETGEGADLYVGAALNIIYGITDVLLIDEDEIKLTQDIILVPDGFETEYVYTQSHILENVIPALEQIQDFESAAMWQQIIDLNDSLKSAAKLKRDRSFNGGGSTIDESETIDILESTELSFQTTICKEVATAAGLNVGGIGALHETKVSTSMGYGGSKVNTSSTSTTTGFHLEDDDHGDNFAVDIKYDSIYGTPVFELVSGQSMCPWEDNTQSIQACSFDQTGYTKQEIVGNSVTFEDIQLKGIGEKDTILPYVLSVLVETNPYGAVIEVDGVNISGTPVLVNIINGSSITKSITFMRPDPSVYYEYTDIVLKLEGVCSSGGSGEAAYATLNAYFVAPCTNVSITAPGDNWIVNKYDPSLEVSIGGYDITNQSFQSIDFQYRYYGSTGWESWATKKTYQKENLGEDVTTYAWNLQANPDGEYQVRAVANCTNSQTTISLSKTGFLDKSDPVLVSSGPANVLEPGDEIFFKYDEKLNNLSVNLTNCTLHFIDSMQTDLPVNIALFEVGKKIRFQIPSNMKYFAENNTLVAKVSGVEDIYGNQLEVPDSVIFYVDLGPLHWSTPTNITIYDDDGMDITFSKELDNSFATSVYYQIWHADWLTPDPQQGQIGAQESWPINFAADELEPGIYYDTIKASVLGFAYETIRLKIIVGNVAPQFVVQPVSQTAAPGETVIFEAYADGFPSPHYYWKKDGEVIPDEIDSLLILQNVTAANMGSYQCFAWNDNGTVASEIATLNLEGPPTHIINLTAGWSGLSSYLMPANANIQSIYSNILDELVIAATDSGIFYPAQNINTIGVWEQHSAYKVKTYTGVTLNIVGSMEENRILQLDDGWNLIPVVSSCPVDAETLFAPVESNLEIVKEVAGYGVYWPAMGINTLETLNPGKAYYVLMDNTVSVTFGECTKSTSETLTGFKTLSGLVPWELTRPTASSHSFAILFGAIKNYEEGSIIGAFDQAGNCWGVTTCGNGASCLNTFGDDTYSERKDGFVAGEKILFKVYWPSTGDEYEIIPEYDQSLPNANGVFTDNGLSAITGFKTSGTGTSPHNSTDILLVPNPTKGLFSIWGISPDAEVKIFDMRGQQIQSEFGKIGNGIEFNLSGRQTGIYIVQIFSEGEYVYKKLILD